MERTREVVSENAEGSIEPSHTGGLEFRFGDDVALEVPDLDGEDVEDLSEDLWGVLGEEASTAHRLGICRGAASFMRGGAPMVSFVPDRKMTNEKMFKVSSLIRWAGGNPDVVVDALRAGRVRARLSAAMGTGKSTLLPFYVAEQMDHRVLYVSLDTGAINQASLYATKRGLGRMRRERTNRVKAWVQAMTYHDFSMAGTAASRELFKCVDTVIFDEAFVKNPDVKASLKQFAALAQPSTNMLLCSATIEENDGDKPVESKGLGNVRQLEVLVSPEEAIASGKLVGTYLCDRTFVVVPTDERVGDLGDHYRQHGVDVRMLDSAARDDEIAATEAWLEGDSSTPRVVVAHPRFAIAFNFRFDFGIIWPLVAEYVVEGDVMTWREIKMTKSMLSQAVSRLGRGIGDSSSVLVMGPPADDEEYYSEASKFKEFILLTAGYIRPLEKGQLGGIYDKFPSGLSAQVAQAILKVNLPAEIAVRYLAADGKYAQRYVRALQTYAHLDHFLPVSDHELPVGHSEWRDQPLIGAEESGVVVKVPLLTEGECKVVMQAVTAMVEGKISVKKWRIPVYTAPDFDDLSDSESKHPLSPSRKLRSVRSIPKLEIPPRSPTQIGWTYEATEMNAKLGGKGSRSGVVVDKARMLEAVTHVIGMVDNFRILEAPVSTLDSAGGVLAQVEIPRGDVDTPNGSLLCQISGELSMQLNSVGIIGYAQFAELVQVYRVHTDRLVTSRLFDCLGNPWSSVLLTFNNEDSVDALVRAGVATFAYEFLATLSSRFAFELQAVVKGSNVYKRRYLKLFKRAPTTDEVMGAIRKGKFSGLAQSERYLQRVVTIKQAMDQALVIAEQKSVYLPFQVTDAQRVLPIHPKTVLGRVGDGEIIEGSAGIMRGHKPASSREWKERMRNISSSRGGQLFEW